MENSKLKKSVIERIGNFFALAGLLTFMVPALAAFGIGEPLTWVQRALGAFGESGALLFYFIGAYLIAALFGTVERIVPVLSGLMTGLLLFAGAFEVPYLTGIRSALFRFAPFQEAAPALFAGALAVIVGNLMGRSPKTKAIPGLLIPFASGIALLIVLAAWSPFTKSTLNLDASSVERAIQSISSTLGKEYVNPEVEKAVRQIMEEKNKTLAEKEQAFKELQERLERTEADKKALERSLQDSNQLSKQLEAAKKALDDMKGRLESQTPLVQGGRYDQAVQPADPLVRDFAVKAASAAPGSWDNPQGSRIPNGAGAHQLVLIHGAISRNWKYVSDPAVSWTDYTSPARRTLVLGLAGDCDDYATLMASCIIAVGGRGRIVHGIKGNQGHAWAEVWIGQGAMADRVLSSVASFTGRNPGQLAVSVDVGTDNRWLVLDWELGRYSFPAKTITVAWTSD